VVGGGGQVDEVGGLGPRAGQSSAWRRPGETGRGQRRGGTRGWGKQCEPPRMESFR
jgi:hypothetical protein